MVYGCPQQKRPNSFQHLTVAAKQAPGLLPGAYSRCQSSTCSHPAAFHCNNPDSGQMKGDGRIGTAMRILGLRIQRIKRAAAAEQ